MTKPTTHSLAMVVLAWPLMMLATTEISAQDQADDASRLTVCLQLVARLQEQVEKKDETITAKNTVITGLEAAQKLQDQKVLDLEKKINELENHIFLYQGIVEDTDKIIQNYRDQVGLYNQSIKDRDNLIKELAKPRRTSTWQKVAETVVPVASIIALATAKNGN